MKDLVEKVLKHPIASVVIISSAAEGVATIINAVRGTNTGPKFSIQIGPKNKKEESQ